MDDTAITEGIREFLDDAVARLTAADARSEAHAAFVPRRRVLLFTRPATFIPLGRVWRLGVFLLDPDGVLFATGSTTRAVPPGYPGYQSTSAEERRGFRAAAFNGPFPEGETVNFGATAIDIDASALRTSTGPLFIAREKLLVRWNPSASADTAVGFERYLDERVDLLIHPPEGA